MGGEDYKNGKKRYKYPCFDSREAVALSCLYHSEHKEGCPDTAPSWEECDFGKKSKEYIEYVKRFESIIT